MERTPPEIIIAYMISVLFWILAAGVIWLAGKQWVPLKDFRDRMSMQWKPALGIAVLFAISNALKGSPLNMWGIAGTLLGGIMTFSQAIIGLALARSLLNYEPLPVVGAITKRERVLRSLFLLVGFALLAVVTEIVAGMIGTGVARLLGEVQQAGSGSQSAMPPLWQLFFHYLAGAGIAEETVYRLVVVSLVWKLTSRPWIGMVISGLLFGAYHLTPLSGMYLTFWQYPLTQFISSAFIGVVWAYVYIKRGYETAVLAHTLSDWLPAAAFTLFAS